MVQLKREVVKQLKMIYEDMPSKEAIPNRPRENLSVLPHFPSGGGLKKEGLEKWLCKWEVMDYLKITKTTYYRWRREGKLVPRNGIGEDRYLWDDIKNIVKKRIG